MKGIFWIIIACMYLVLAIASLITSREHAKDSALKHSSIFMEGKPFMKATFDYLNKNTWINFIGFLLAAIAALLTFF